MKGIGKALARTPHMLCVGIMRRWLTAQGQQGRHVVQDDRRRVR